MSLEETTIIIRSVGERTESLCKKLILQQGVPENAIHIINEIPFSKAMKVGFEKGISEKRPWTVCVDADVLLRPGSILKMILHAENQPKNVCEIQGFVLDKFFGGARKGGIHLYRTSLLDKVIKEIPAEGVDIRPETYALNAMQNKGYPWHTVEELVGLHDFEQSYEDIFRKCFVHSHKHLNYSELFIPFWRIESLRDNDYQVALLGFTEGIKHFGEVRIDKNAKYFADKFSMFHLAPKNEIYSYDLYQIESIIEEWKEPEKYWIYFPTWILVTSTNPFIKIIKIYNFFISRNTQYKSIKLFLIYILKSVIYRLQK
jgi:hypothetical protein